ncbi:YciN family protein [Vibrio sp. MEBiC08052]|uniref:YciN family protein n=1 Tax=Vibrio sp. MEBiC08052 TaxID=1761910 RepID=UPI00074078DC|nr:YciN family protein [Vibrio sp. MEBiC08052]KUI99037.1 protein YciN [Vibrio sp. MEBiC08052]
MNNKKAISVSDLLMIANQLIQEHEHYIEGMRAESVEEKDGVLVFKGNYFLDEQGLPTAKTTAVFNMFKYLAHQLSKEFTLPSEARETR